MTVPGSRPESGRSLLESWGKVYHGQLSCMPDKEQELLPSMQYMQLEFASLTIKGFIVIILQLLSE